MNRIENIGKIAGAVTAVLVLIATIITLFSKPDPVVIELRGANDEPEPKSAKPALVATVVETIDPDEPQPLPANAAAPDKPADVAVDIAPSPQVPAPAALLPEPDAEAPDWTPETRLRVVQGQTVTVCPDAQRLSLSVAKQGTRADTGIYLLSPRPSGRIEVGETFALSDVCALTLDRTGKTGSYFAEITFVGTSPE